MALCLARSSSTASWRSAFAVFSTTGSRLASSKISSNAAKSAAMKASTKSPKSPSESSKSKKPENDGIKLDIPSKWSEYSPKEILKLTPSVGPRPKKPAPAFASYVKANFGSVNQKGTEAIKTLGTRYKSLSPTEKQKMVDQAAKDRVQWTNEMQAWMARLTPEDKQLLEFQRYIRARLDGKSARPPQHPDKPRQPLNTYIRWCNDQREKLKADPKFRDLPPKEFVSKLGDMWRSLPESARKPYQEQSKLEMDKYRAALQKFKMTT